MQMGEWWNGLHNRLKICPAKNGCGFESHLAHQLINIPLTEGFFLSLIQKITYKSGIIKEEN